MIWFYGGSWASGDRAKYAFVAKRFTELGYAVAIPDYRLVPDIHFPAFIEDGASTIAFMDRYAKQNPKLLADTPVMLAGHSAGAYNAVQVVADKRYLDAVGLDSSAIAGIIGLSGPYDFIPMMLRPHKMRLAARQPMKANPWRWIWRTCRHCCW